MENIILYMKDYLSKKIFINIKLISFLILINSTCNGQDLIFMRQFINNGISIVNEKLDARLIYSDFDDSVIVNNFNFETFSYINNHSSINTKRYTLYYADNELTKIKYQIYNETSIRNVYQLILYEYKKYIFFVCMPYTKDKNDYEFYYHFILHDKKENMNILFGFFDDSGIQVVGEGLYLHPFDSKFYNFVNLLYLDENLLPYTRLSSILPSGEILFSAKIKFSNNKIIENIEISTNYNCNFGAIPLPKNLDMLNITFLRRIKLVGYTGTYCFKRSLDLNFDPRFYFFSTGDMQ
jgi:hypothetical protein